MHQFVMTETGRMKNPTQSLAVFDFTADDELDHNILNKCAPKSGYPRARDVSRNEIHHKEISVGICRGTNVDTDYNPDANGLLTPIESEDCAEGSDFSCGMHHDFKNHGQAAENKPQIIETSSILASAECGSSFCANVQLEDDLNIGFQQASCNDMSTHLAADVDESMSERSPSAVTSNNDSSDGPLTGNWSSVWNLGDGRVSIDLYPDHLYYCGTNYPESVVNFSKSFVEARSKNMCGEGTTFQFHLEVEDVVKIESRWNARYETGIVNIFFISKGGMQNNKIHNASAPGLQVLELVTVDSNWYQKLEAIKSLDVRYKALWSVLLDTGSEEISPLSEGKTVPRTTSYFPKFDKPFEEVIYPEGDPDAVSISKRDIDLLLPETFVNDTIIDFYVKYLKSRQNVQESTKFHFFNSFFFRKLADMDKDPSSAFDGKAAFHRVRKWTRKINLLEKDFIFIPVNYNYHWSLLVICYFGEVATYKDGEDGKSLREPCILHMDSLVGNHVGLKGLLQSYLWEEWKERHKETSEDLHSNFKNLKFIPLELPQQQNSYDCGLFLLHYVELFLEEVPNNFSIHQITSSSNFLKADWFPPSEASLKRTCIVRLISGLIDSKSEDCPFGGNEMHCSPEGPRATSDYDNGVGFSIVSGHMSACREGSMHLVDQEIDMSLLSHSPTRNTRMVLNELFNEASVPLEALGRRSSFPEDTVEEFLASGAFTMDEAIIPYSTPDHTDSSSQETSSSDSDDDVVELETNGEIWKPVEAAGHVNQNEVDYHGYSSPEKRGQYTSSHMVERDDLNNVDMTLSLEELCEEEGNEEKKSQCLSGKRSRTLAEMNDLSNVDMSFSFCQEGKQVMESSIPCGEVGLGSDGGESDEEQRLGKRMRVGDVDL